MIVLPDKKVVVVATPRTGSRSLKEAILHGCPTASATKYHHPFPYEVLKVKEAGHYEVWTIIREPLSQLKSWMFYQQATSDPMKFIKTFDNRYFCYHGGMNIYNQEVDRYFIYEQGGHQKMLDALGIDEELPHIGKTKSLDFALTEEHEQAARRRFAFDFDLYNRVLEGESS